MKLHLLFIGNKFIYNNSLKEYVLRNIESKCDYLASVTHYKENDNSLFLYLEQELNNSSKIVIVTTKQNFSTIGKIISTITSDNQILKDNMLIPQNSSVFENGSYLLEYKESLLNVISMDEMKKMPELLINNEESVANINIFDEDKETALALLNSLSQTHDVNIEVTTIVEGWLRVNITGNRYGNISNFIKSAKQLLPSKLITASSIVEHIIEVLSRNNKTLSFAESCTGGLLTYYFTKHNGASKILHGSLVTYSNDLKDNWLGVEHKVLEEFGAVSEEVVEQMSEGVMNVSDADYTISVSGIAGDTGGTPSKPVGTVYVSIRTKTQHKECRLNLQGDRNYVQQQSALEAIKMLVNSDKEMFF